MASLQSRLDEFKKTFESGAPPYNAPQEAIETIHRATAELNSRISDARRNMAIDAARLAFMNTFGWMALQNAIDGLTPKVTHKICYTDENGKQSCQ
jgi:hypothetical protein